jgi:hypothetical protein
MTEKKTPTPAIPEPELETAVVDPDATTTTDAVEPTPEPAPATADPQDGVVGEVLELTGEHYAQLIDLDAIAAQLNLTDDELATLEVVQVGVSWTSRTGTRVGKFVRVTL